MSRMILAISSYGGLPRGLAPSHLSQLSRSVKYPHFSYEETEAAGSRPRIHPEAARCLLTDCVISQPPTCKHRETYRGELAPPLLPQCFSSLLQGVLVPAGTWFRSRCRRFSLGRVGPGQDTSQEQLQARKGTVTFAIVPTLGPGRSRFPPSPCPMTSFPHLEGGTLCGHWGCFAGCGQRAGGSKRSFPHP